MAARASFESSMINTRGDTGAAGFFTALTAGARLEFFCLGLARIGMDYIGNDRLALILLKSRNFRPGPFAIYRLQVARAIFGRAMN